MTNYPTAQMDARYSRPRDAAVKRRRDVVDLGYHLRPGVQEQPFTEED
jgi:hypothetical protein